MNTKQLVKILKNSISQNSFVNKVITKIEKHSSLPNTISIKYIRNLVKEQKQTDKSLLFGFINEAFSDRKRLPPSMTSLEERKVLKYLTSKLYQGRGEIIDLGSGVGGTVYPLALGLDRNQLVSSKHQRIHAYDLFTPPRQNIKSRGAKLYFSQKDDLDKNNFDCFRNSYLDIFQNNCEKYLNYIEIHDGNITELSWNKKPIEIIHIDIAKNINIWRHIVEIFFDSLIPNKSIIIHQDFERARLPWLMYSLGLMLPYIELLDPVVNGTLYCKLVKPLPQEIIDRLKLDNFSVEQKIQFITDVISAMKNLKFYGSINYELMQDLKDLAIAYVYFYAGEKKQSLLELERKKSKKYLVRRFPEFFKEIEKSLT